MPDEDELSRLIVSVYENSTIVNGPQHWTPGDKRLIVDAILAAIPEDKRAGTFRVALAISAKAVILADLEKLED